ncbi:CD99 antigen [Kryptolebias marmoratus]|uniref:CD99 antigen n=1 Tax=Kryptolebias marmoratus TaxID=37003 RepID=UPI0007F87F7D|nr:CD99 antigen [Kryptolebias marmoratus]
MMSYLWILLLGSLLASHAKAQDVTEAPDTDGTDQVDEDKPTTVAPTPNTQPGVVETTPAPSGSEVTSPPDVAETTVALKVPEETPAADAETTTPEVPAMADAETESPTGEVPIETTTAAEAALTTQGAGSGVTEAGPEETTQNVEEEVPSTTPALADSEMNGGDMTTTLAPIDDQTTPAPVNVEPEVKKSDASEPNTGAEFDLGDALDDSKEEIGKSRSLNPAPVIDAPEGDKPEVQEGSSKTLAGILSAIVVSAVGAVSGYFAYQKKKLCFKKSEEADPEAGHKTDKVDVAEAQSDPQVLSNLLSPSQQ